MDVHCLAVGFRLLRTDYLCFDEESRPPHTDACDLYEALRLLRTIGLDSVQDL